MATLKATRALAGVPARTLHAGAIVETSRYTASATVSNGDVVQMVKVPAGARVVDLTYGCSVAGTVAIGDGLDTNRYRATASIAVSTVLSGVSAIAGLNYEYTADDTIDVHLAAKFATTVPVIDLHVTYVVDN